THSASTAARRSRARACSRRRYRAQCCVAAGAVRRRCALVSVCAAEFGAAGRAARLLLAARPAGSVESAGTAAVPGRDLALTRRTAAKTLRARRRGLAADARTGRRQVPAPACEV